MDVNTKAEHIFRSPTCKIISSTFAVICLRNTISNWFFRQWPVKQESSFTPWWCRFTFRIVSSSSHLNDRSSHLPSRQMFSQIISIKTHISRRGDFVSGDGTYVREKANGPLNSHKDHLLLRNPQRISLFSRGIINKTWFLEWESFFVFVSALSDFLDWSLSMRAISEGH